MDLEKESKSFNAAADVLKHMRKNEYHNKIVG
jgi:hypothetical protein